MRPSALLPLLVLLALAGAVVADRTTAEFFAQRGDKALKEKDYAAAEQHYRRALEDDPTFLPARQGLGEALFASEKPEQAIEEWRAFVAAVEALPTCPPAWAPALQKARKRLTEVDAAGAQLEQLVDRHVASLLSLAAKWLEKEPDVAHRALSAVLRLRPGHAKAQDLLEKLGRKAQEARVALFDGKSGNGWSYLDMPVWSVEGGAIVGTADKDGFICQTEKHFEGDFDVVVEMRILEERGRGSMAEMGGAMKDLYRRSTLGIHDGRLVWTESETANDFREVFSAKVGELAHPFDPKAWNVYELRFRGSLLHAVVNGEVVSTQPRPEGRDKGMVGLRVRNVKAAFRRVDIVPR